MRNRKILGVAGLEFLFKEFIEEIDAMSHMARPFIAPESSNVLGELRGTLQSIQESKTQTMCRWEIRQDRPLRTITSKGKYEQGGGGRHHVYAEVTSVWEIQALRPKKKAQQWVKFALGGKASTRVRLFRDSAAGQPEELAMWQMEVADENSPGCYFHVQIRRETEELPFPSSLPVPRLPFFLPTPTVALEFALGELFQDKWRMEGLLEDDYLRLWRRIQSKRLTKFLDWQGMEVRANGALGSPWVRLKILKPRANLFLEE